MSGRYCLRERAESDLEEIWLYTFEQWGREQADSYTTLIIRRFEWLANNPLAGRSRADIKSGYYCFPEGRHLIFYTIQSACIEIIGVLHQSMDYVENFPPDG
jgi:toxin ParE1/3/4